MQKRRLLKLAAFLRTVPRLAFEMDSWQARAATKPEGKKPGGCGFAGCAVGWAAHGRLFRGLTILADGHVFPVPYYKGRINFGACESLFDIDCNVSSYLFSPNRYDNSLTPKQVAKRIEKFVANDGLV